jgi:hypothetical protein
MNGDAPKTLTCSVDMHMQHGHGHAPWTWGTAWKCACSMGILYMDRDMSMERDVQHRQGHAAWTGTSSLDLVMQHEHGQDVDIDYI